VSGRCVAGTDGWLPGTLHQSRVAQPIGGVSRRRESVASEDRHECGTRASSKPL
jgi:hypothetical protein